MNHQKKYFPDGEIQPVAPDIVDDEMFYALPQDGTVDDDDRDQGETVFVTKKKQIRVAMQHEHYKRRGEKLKDPRPENSM